MSEPVVELNAGAAGRSKGIWEEIWQCLKHNILQAGKEKRGQQMFEGNELIGRTPLGS